MNKGGLQELIQELAERYSTIGEKVLVLQASENVVCCGVYKKGVATMVHTAILLYNTEQKKWEIIENEATQETVHCYFAYFSSLLNLVDEHLGRNKEEFGIDIDKDFLSN